MNQGSGGAPQLIPAVSAFLL
uniref:Uncharacterized protein n=1 Tax=Arundo donax TaxID=35708 RepID=A0A0A8ZEQ2_ARUDO